MGQNHSGNPSKAEILRENVTHNSPILYIHFYSKIGKWYVCAGFIE